MPTFRAISRTVNLASLSMISFIFETISLRDANFGHGGHLGHTYSLAVRLS